MHRSCFAAALFSIMLVAACGDSSSSPQTDGPPGKDGSGDGAVAQQDGSQQGDGPGQQDAAVPDDGGAPASHTEDNGGVMHMPGKEAPKVNCASCHGADLTGGTAASCYGCHTTADHTINRGGHLHKSGSSSTCVPCHGAFSSSTGALAKGCSSAGCH